MSFIEVVLSLYKVLAIVILFSSMILGLPPNLPLALADFKPALVLSLIISLSNSAKAANI